MPQDESGTHRSPLLTVPECFSWYLGQNTMVSMSVRLRRRHSPKARVGTKRSRRHLPKARVGAKRSRRHSPKARVGAKRSRRHLPKAAVSARQIRRHLPKARMSAIPLHRQSPAAADARHPDHGHLPKAQMRGIHSSSARPWSGDRGRALSDRRPAQDCLYLINRIDLDMVTGDLARSINHGDLPGALFDAVDALCSRLEVHL